MGRRASVDAKHYRRVRAVADAGLQVGATENMPECGVPTDRGGKLIYRRGPKTSRDSRRPTKQ